jgi:hypothetical protein
MTLKQAVEVAEITKAELKNSGYKFYQTIAPPPQFAKEAVTEVHTDANNKLRVYINIFEYFNERPKTWACSMWTVNKGAISELKIDNTTDYTDKLKEFIKTCDELVLQEQNK